MRKNGGKEEAQGRKHLNDLRNEIEKNKTSHRAQCSCKSVTRRNRRPPTTTTLLEKERFLEIVRERRDKIESNVIFHGDPSCLSTVGSRTNRKKRDRRACVRANERTRVSRRTVRTRRRKTSSGYTSAKQKANDRGRDRILSQVVRIRSMRQPGSDGTHFPASCRREHRTHNQARAHIIHASTKECVRCVHTRVHRDTLRTHGCTHRRGISRLTLPSRATGHIYIRADPWKRRAQPFSTLGSTYFTVT